MYMGQVSNKEIMAKLDKLEVKLCKLDQDLTTMKNGIDIRFNDVKIQLSDIQIKMTEENFINWNSTSKGNFFSTLFTFTTFGCGIFIMGVIAYLTNKDPWFLPFIILGGGLTIWGAIGIYLTFVKKKNMGKS